MTRRNHLLFAAVVGLMALLLLLSGIAVLVAVGVGSQDNVFAVPLLAGALGAAALALRHLLAALRSRK